MCAVSATQKNCQSQRRIGKTTGGCVGAQKELYVVMAEEGERVR